MCGASSEQKQIEQKQSALLDQMMNQSQGVFGDSSQVFKDLQSAFSPIVAAGPNQPGFSAPELSALKSSAKTNTGEVYRHESQAVREANAAVGGGNEYLPGGAEIGRNIEVANRGAARTADALNKIDVLNYETGHENYFQAAKGLAGAPEVFNPATSASNAATGAGTAAADTANQIAQQNNSWVSAVTGALGGIAGSAASGFMAPKPKPTQSSTPPDFSGFTYEGPEGTS